jgi:hypothetical protein
MASKLSARYTGSAHNGVTNGVSLAQYLRRAAGDDALALTHVNSLAQLWEACYQQRTAAAVFNDSRKCSLADTASKGCTAWHIHR